MDTLRCRALAPLALVTLIACGDSAPAAAPNPDLSTAMPDLSAPPDLSPPPPDLQNPLGIGAACATSHDCAAGLVCIGSGLSPTLPSRGYCTRLCKDDVDCGANAFCGPPLPNAGNLCWLRCGPGDTCGDSSLVCARRLGGFVDLVVKACVPGKATARDGDACKTFGDCNHDQACVTNRFENPGGECVTVGCSVGNDATCVSGAASFCSVVDAMGTTACLPRCGKDADCRAAEGYVCAAPAPGLPMLCLFPHASTGDACAKDSDCGPAPWSCLMQQGFAGNYCTGIGCDPTDASTCPSNATCVTMPGGTTFCARGCSQSAPCRAGYSCKLAPNSPAQACLP